MADDDDHTSGCSVNFDLNSIFRGDIGEMLAKVDSKLASDVVDDMTEAYDMSTLLDIRIKMFRFAKKKLLETVTEPGNKDMDPIFDKTVSHGCLSDAQRMTDEWALIARKGKPRVAMDTIDFLSYVSGECPYFPYKIVKKNPKKGKNGRGGRRNKQQGKKQPLIPFTPTSIMRNNLSKTGDDGSVTSDAPASERDTCDNDSQTDLSEYETSDASDNGTEADYNEICANINDEHQGADNAINAQIPSTGEASSVSVPPREQVDPQGSESTPSLPAVETSAVNRDLHNQATGLSALSVGHAQTGSGEETNSRPSTERADQHTCPSTGTNDAAQPVISKHTPIAVLPTTMATQTEWDLWGSPVSNGRGFISPSKPANTCNCEYNVRLLLDWKREAEKRIEANGEQERARSNYLRARLTKSEEEREKMRATMSTMSRQISANATMIADVAGRGIAPGMNDYSARVFSCETGNASRFDLPCNSPNPSILPQSSISTCHPDAASKGNPSVPSSSSSRAEVPRADTYLTRPGPTSTQSSHTSAPYPAPLPQRPRGQADRSSGSYTPAGQVSARETDRGQQSSGAPGGGYGRNAPPTAPSRRDAEQRPSENNIGNLRAVNVNFNASDNSDRPSGRTPLSWADDPMSDADLICVSDETVSKATSRQGPSAETAHELNTGPPRSNGPRGPNVGRPAPTPQSGQPDNNNRKGEKRLNDGQIQSNDRSNTYADAARKEFDWNVMESKRTKRNSNDESLNLLLGARSMPHKEIFVKHLDYSMCSKPADLEGRVKAYCRRKGVYILQARVFEQSDCNRANCRVSLKEEDVVRALEPDFWPQYAIVRNWSVNPQNDQGWSNEGGNVDTYNPA